MKKLPTPIQSLVRACDLLQAFREEAECLRLAELVERTGLSKTTTFRILSTLVECGMLTRVGGTKYRLNVHPLRPRSYKLGHAIQSNEFTFCRAVARSLERSARAANIELLLLDNRDSPRTALANAEVFVRERVDLVIEAQSDVQIAEQISNSFRSARIPMIAIEIPHPHSVYYGANNSQAGLMAGRHLARWAAQNWAGKIDELLLLELPKAGQLPNGRILGSLLGLMEHFPGVANKQITMLKTSGHMESAHEKVRQHLRKSRGERILVSAINDPCALGALLAFREAGREAHCAVVSQNASEEVHPELRKPGSRLIGSVGYFPERYGEGVIPIALDLLAARRVPHATFVRHQMVTAANLDSFYPRVS
jgi:ribose transport system substrate-binding protein